MPKRRAEDFAPEDWPTVCRTVRALIHWSQEDLALAAQVSINTIKHIEQAKADVTLTTWKVLCAAFSDPHGADVDIHEDEDGYIVVRWRKAHRPRSAGTTS